ncbi:MAG: FAD-dependent oxidoreductase, partial [Ilumatobacteraceae bacterium]
MEPATEFDLVIIGGGPGGYGAALYAASAGLNAALVEMADIGGTCLNRGCIPAKAFLETAAVNRHVAHAGDFGIESSAPVVNFATAQARKQKIVDGIVKSLTGFMKSKKITIFNGVGTLGADHTVTVSGPEGTSNIRGTNVVLAGGSVPRTIPGFEPAGPVMTSDEVLMLDHVPPR